MISSENNNSKNEIIDFSIIDIENFNSENFNDKMDMKLHRNDIFSIILYLVNMIERDTYVLKTQDVKLSNVDYFNGSKSKSKSRRSDCKLVYLVPINKKGLVHDYINMLFTRFDDGKSAEQNLNDDLNKLNINNNNYVVLSYYKDIDAPYITYNDNKFVTYDVTSKAKSDTKIKLVDKKFDYIYQYLDLVYGYAMSTKSKKVSYKELKTLALYFARNYMNRENQVKVKMIKG